MTTKNLCVLACALGLAGCLQGAVVERPDAHGETLAPPPLAIDYNSYRTSAAYNKRVRYLVLHYTALDFSRSVEMLTRGPGSAHYLVPSPADASYRRAGFSGQRIFNLVDENDRAWHAGVSSWGGREGLNDSSIGIEIVNLARDDDGVFTFPDYEPSQIEALKQLARNILQRYPDISPKHVLGHSDIAVGRKSDPGPKLPWKELHDAGIGAWYDDATRDRYQARFERDGLPSRAEWLEALRRYGYAVPERGNDEDFANLLRAFQMHFRPDNHDGVADAETAAILYALNERYS
ncbi:MULTISPECIES: N-acetylmuramoyl-L-alanine amidase [Pseudomonas aeruginosa group]|uniref:N-acetylmuramoyl-L-alanine amidase n=1 Tax=Pseudomonas aeruginosa group TaxID=136841 RepID=UPI002109CEAE|nr:MULTISPECIES: N-acetylmuramoyl-L-alanine amidase [Pseudomonas aeruginosa group]MCW8025343.1 N-acetylmuramoyl-L-alanine amidase [Pseudomonas aeruginosa]MDY1576404.1 N-acetylmuramoyl-L-alanine amidase [Pseudomonas paraeruginosa]UYT18651.1 N-acetylmuramoyl-L-alanine amidase [Pseudomonas aeruginosa]